MKDKIEISIIIPVYNVEKYLKQCLDSILMQTFKNFQIICIDDESTDNSLKILQSYKEKDDRFVIIQQPHSGAFEARNKGIKFAEGKYIQFLDSDDYFEPNLLEEMFNRAEKFNADLVVCSYKKIDDKNNIVESNNPNSAINIDKVPLEKPFCRNDFKDEIFSLLTPVPWNKLYKKDLIIKNNITFPKLLIYEDIAFVHSAVACANKIIVFDKELINYRFNRYGSLVSKRSKNTIDAVKSCIYLRDFLILKNLYNDLEVAYKKALINHIRAEISYCNDIEYNNFLESFKKLLPNNWNDYQQALKKDYITLEYLNKFIGNKQVMLWGASLFIKQLLEKEFKKNDNIIGIIDRNPASMGKYIGNYKIYSPDAINNLRFDGIILTVFSNNEAIYESLKYEIKEKYPNIELLPNIFDKELTFC